MSNKTNKLRVEGLAPDIDEEMIKITFSNAKRNGGGPIEDIHLDKSDNATTAVITFETTDAVDLILSRGKTLNVLKSILTVEPVFNNVRNKLSTASLSESDDQPEDNSRKQSKGITKRTKPKKSNEKLKAKSSKNPPIEENVVRKEKPTRKAASVKASKVVEKQKERIDSSDDQEALETTSSRSRRTNGKLKHRSSEKAIFEERQAGSETLNSSEEDVDCLWERTIKATLKDHTLVSKDRYKYYFEDPGISQGPFVEESLLLDGMNKLVYVTFETKKAAQATCRFKHQMDDSNFLRVEMAKQEDFDTYTNLLLVHLFDPGHGGLKEHVEALTKMNVHDILLGEDVKKAIIVFDPKCCEDMAEATWACAEDNQKIIHTPALVKRTYSIRVKNMKSTTPEKLLSRYLSSPKSGGGPVKSTEKVSPTEAIVYFQNEEGFAGVLEKDNHVLEGNTLYLESYYPCLSHPLAEKKDQLTDVRKNKFEPHSHGFQRHSSLYFSEKKIYLLSSVKCINKMFHGSLYIDKDGSYFLSALEKDLDTYVRNYECTCRPQFSDGPEPFLMFSLDCRTKLVAAEVKRKLHEGISAVCEYLDQFQLQKSRIDESYIHQFQEYCQGTLQSHLYGAHIRFNHVTNQIIVLCERGEEKRILDLLKEVYQRLLSGSSVAKVEIDVQENTNVKQLNEGVGLENNNVQVYEETEHFDLEKLILLQKAGKCNDMMKADKSLEVTIDIENHRIIVKGKNEKSVKQAQKDLLCFILEFQRLNITNSFSPRQLKLLSRKPVCEKINELFDEQNCVAYFHCSGKNAVLYMPSKSVNEKCEKVIQSQAIEKEKEMDKDTVVLFESEKGRKFLADLSASDDDIKPNAEVQLQKYVLHVVASASSQDIIAYEIDTFIKENKLHTKQIPFSTGKWTFTERFLKSELKEIQLFLEKEKTKLTRVGESVQLKGLSDCVAQGEVKLTDLREKITQQDMTFKYFGVKEFLKNPTGANLLARIEDKQFCCIMPKTGMVSNLEKGRPVEIARTTLMSCTISIIQGDITCLTTDVIVNPVDSSFNCSSGLSKALIAKAGRDIQRELNTSSAGRDGGVIQTSAGQLQGCQAIVHVVCPIFKQTGDEAQLLEKAYLDCLEHVNNKNFKSVALPIMGTGKIFLFETVLAHSTMITSLKKFVGDQHSGLSQIILCDTNAYNIMELLKRFELMVHKMEMLASPVESHKDKGASVSYGASSPRPSSPMIRSSKPTKKDFKNIQVTTMKGEITEQRTDAIVITANKNLDLSKGVIAQAVLKYGGQSIQQELQDNYTVIKTGEFAQTSGGNLQCQHIFHAVLPKRNRDKLAQVNRLVYKILEAADAEGATSISIPALGTGKLGYSEDEVADLITDAISNFARQHSDPTLKTVNLVVYPKDDSVYWAFQAAVSGNTDSHRRGGRDSDFRATDSLQNKFGSVNFSVKVADITNEKCDAIVCGIKDSMDLSNSSSVCKSLLKKCGSGLQDECNNQTDEMEDGGIVKTSAPNLKCDNIFFVSMVQFSRKWDEGTEAVLLEAEKQGMRSIALPAFGSGSKNADYQVVKNKIFEGVKRFSKSSPNSLKDVRLVVYSQETLNQLMGQDRGHRVERNREAVTAGHARRYVTTIVSEAVDLRFYSTEASKIQAAIQELEQQLKRSVKQDTDESKSITKISEDQVRELEEEGIKNCVRVKVKQDQGRVYMESLNSEGFLPVNKKLQQIIRAIDEEDIKQLHQTLPLAVTWQYETEEDRWRNFDKSLSIELEAKYKKKARYCDIIDARGHNYRIQFKDMKEYQVDQSGNISDRPCSIRRVDLTRSDVALPKRWAAMNKNENLKLVPVKSDSEEFKAVLTKFSSTGGGGTIKKLERIQNKSLYQQFKAKKNEMDLQNPKGHVNEQRLYHGTDPNAVQAILDNGFNRNYRGKNATAYGNGVYFAVNAQLSVGYTRADSSGERKMFQARVLTGESTNSSSGMNHLPNKPGTTRPYDSGTASGMYIIFHDVQAYPEYLITF